MDTGTHPKPEADLGSRLRHPGAVQVIHTPVLRTRLTWLLVFRTAVVTVLLVISVALKVWSRESPFAPAALALYGVAGLSYASILFGALWLRLYDIRGIYHLAYSQLMFDAGMAAAVVALTGGVNSIFVFLFSLSILNAAAVLQKQGANTLAAVVTAFYSFVLGAELAGVPIIVGADSEVSIASVLPTFVTNAASSVLIAILAGFLSEQLQRTSESLDVARAEIVRLEALSHAVLAHLPSGVVTVDAVGTVAYVNEKGAELLGAVPAALVGTSLADAPGAFPLPAHGAPSSRFEERSTLHGRERTIGGTVAELGSASGFPGRVVVFQDLTELRRLEEELALRDRLSELGRFAAGLAHEIRNPLAAMVGSLQLLKTDVGVSETGDAPRLIGIVQREAERLSILVSEFLTFARPALPTMMEVQLCRLARDIVDAARPGFPATIELTVEGADVVAFCDPEHIRQALWNLLGNAVQVLAEHRGPGATGRIRVAVLRDEHHALIAVEDDGPGVPEGIRDRIFEPFFTTRSDGTGLGLAAVQQMMLQMDGHISLTTSLLGGARFVLALPADPQRPRSPRGG